MNTSARIIMGVLFVGLASSAPAATRTWINTAGGSWETAGNWSPSGSPTNTDDIVISATGPYTVNFNDTTANTGDPTTWLTINSLAINNSVGTPTLLLDFSNAAKQLTVSTTTAIGSATDLGRLVISNGTYIGTGAFTVGGRGSVLLAGGTLSTGAGTTIGNSTGTAQLDVTGGRAIFGGSGQFRIGDGGSSITGIVNVSGGQLAHTGNAFIGISGGRGFLSTSGGTVDLADVALAQGGSSRGTWTITGGTNRVSSALKLGVFGGDEGTASLSSGRLFVTNASANAQVLIGWLGGNGTWAQSGGTAGVDQMFVGNGSGTGTITLSGGTLTINNHFEITGKSSVTVSGGTLNATATGATDLQVGSTAGLASLDVMGGQVTFSGGQFRVGATANATGTVNVTGGLLAYTSGNAFFGISGGVGTLNSSGGRTEFAAPITIGQDSASKGAWNISGGTNWAPGLGVSYGQVWLTGGELNATNSGSAVASIGNSAATSLFTQSNGLFRADTISVESSAGTGTLSLVNGQITMGTLHVGEGSGGKGQLTVLGGTITSSFLGVGISSPGQFDLSNGTVSSSGQIQIGQTSTGIVNMAGGRLSIASIAFITVGSGGVGTLNSSGGSATFAGGVNMGNGSGTVGRWNITGGTNEVSSLNVATSGGDHRVVIDGPGVLQIDSGGVSLGTGSTPGFITNQNGGAVRFVVDDPSINLNGTGSKFAVNNAVVEFKEVSAANVSATGQIATKLTYTGANTLRLNGSTNANVGSATFATGQNFSTLALVNGDTRWQSSFLTTGSGGSLLQSNTRATVTSIFTNNGIFTSLNSVGTFNSAVINNGAWVTDPTTNVFLSDYTVGNSGSISMAAGDVYAFKSNFINQSTQNTTYDTLSGKFLFNGGTGYTQTFATAGKDLGPGGIYPTPPGQTNILGGSLPLNNFVLGTLELTNGTTVTLNDSFPADGLRAALYMDNLFIDSTSRLIISNNVTAYFVNSNGWSFASNITLLGDAELHQLIPEPSVLLLLVAGLGMIDYARRKR